MGGLKLGLTGFVLGLFFIGMLDISSKMQEIGFVLHKKVILVERHFIPMGRP